MRILVVDDEYVSRIKLKVLLSAYGDCDAAHDGEVALSMFEQAHRESVPYSLITLDIEMPDMDGKEVLRRIRSWEKDNDLTASQEVKVLMISVKDNPKEVISSFNEGCESYITKPVNPEKIEAAVKDLAFQVTANPSD